MNTNKTKRSGIDRVLSVLLTLAMLAAMFTAVPITANAAMPTGTTGAANDGVDFGALLAAGNGIYYGAYNHAVSVIVTPDGYATTYEGIRTPVLWRVMGEEGTDGYVTALSEYVLDTAVFRTDYTQSNANVYDASDIKTFLANMATDADNFPAAELSGMAAVDVVTGMYAYSSGEPLTGEQQGTEYPVTSASQKLYLPHGGYDNNKVYWEAGNTRGTTYQLDNTGYSGNKATLKSGGNVNIYHWLRSPFSVRSDRALYVYDGRVDYGSPDLALGVRPAFKINPSAILFASEIGGTGAGATAAGADYVAGSGGATNYKLTVLDTALSGGTLTADAAAFDGADAHPTISAVYGGSVSVAAASATANTKLTYKIVDGNHEIVGYGQGADNAALTVSANLAGGDYTVYVWAQKDNDINSHEGSAPQWFTLTVAPSASISPTTAAFDKYTGAANYADIAVTLTPASYTLTSITNGAALSSGTDYTVSGNVYTIKKEYLATLEAGAQTLTFNMSGGANPTLAVTVSDTTSSDGVDFAALSAPGNGIYYGAYDHATSLAQSQYGAATYAGSRTPILWRVMGEEGSDGYITALSEYVLDSAAFRTDNSAVNANVYNASNIKTFLAAMTADTDNFPAAEQSGMAAVNVVTGMYDYISGAELTDAQQGTDYPVTSAAQRLYLPHGSHHLGTGGDKVYWEAGNTENAAYELAANASGNEAALKSGGYVYYWFRSPYSDDLSQALGVHDSGYIYNHVTYFALGVRPAFKINPSAILFASEIADVPAAGQTAASANYVAGSGGATNYKLTVLNTALSGGTMTANTTAFDGASAHPTVPVVPGGAVNVAAASATADTKLTYKIVDSSQNIVGYGQGADNAALTVDAKDLAGANLADGDYTVYVWAQKDNAINSHEGSAPRWFTLTVDITAPTPGNSGTISTGSVTQNSLTLNWTAATDNASAASALKYYVYQSSSNDLTDANWWTSKTPLNSGGTANIATYDVTGLTALTAYYFNVVAEDEVGNKAAYTAKTETTAATP
ncbi:MAG: DUF6273 domain-containing protein, partial [Oscillospiraceae bacterium]|nr:DUF6273 domain-containing protein [Oscillospiraceae bacterium]